MATLPSSVFKAGPAAFIAAFAVLASYSANAAAVPPVKSAAPGFFRFELGDFEVTALFDGQNTYADDLFPNASAKAINQATADGFLETPIIEPINGFLINTNEHLVLIDTGVGPYFGPNCGHLVDSLRASGYAPEQVDLILLTHLHTDHNGGATINGQKTFPNAELRVNLVETEYWLNAANKPSDPAGAELFTNISRVANLVVTAYNTSGQYQAIDGDQQLVPGIRASVKLGHTPGHTVYFIESLGETLVAWGDISHVEALQFPHPEFSVMFDYSPAQARQARKDLLSLVAKNKYLVAGSHIQFPGVGHIRKGRQQAGYVFVPLEYVSNNTLHSDL